MNYVAFKFYIFLIKIYLQQVPFYVEHVIYSTCLFPEPFNIGISNGSPKSWTSCCVLWPCWVLSFQHQKAMTSYFSVFWIVLHMICAHLKLLPTHFSTFVHKIHDIQDGGHLNFYLSQILSQYFTNILQFQIFITIDQFHY